MHAARPEDGVLERLDALERENARLSRELAVVSATTKGSGPALKAQVSNAKSASAAIVGTGSATGRGAQLAGGAAPLRLVPGGTRPTSGQTGHLFVDGSGHLHFCTAGGATATWVRLA